MPALIFSQAAIFRLQQLAMQYYQQTGRRHKLGNEDGILDLLESATMVTDRKVRRAYDAFVNELNRRQIDALASKGVRLRFPLRTPTYIGRVVSQ